MMNIFKSKRASLIEQKAASAAAHEREDAQRGAEIDRLAADPDVLAYRHAIKLEREIKVLQERRREAASTARQESVGYDAEIRAASDGKIRDFIRWAEGEKARVSREVVTRGIVDRDRLGVETGRILTNARKIETHLNAVSAAISDARRLESSPIADQAAELERIRAGVPLFDGGTETIDTSPGLAAAVS